MLSYEQIREALDEQPLFDEKTWRLSPEAWPLTEAQVAEIEAIGQACLEFYRAMEQLYLRSAEGKNLLRNKELYAPWIADYLDRGKPPELIKHARSKRTRGQLPLVIRPDLLQTEDGFVLTELDSVPGGIGLTAFLNQLYEQDDARIVGGSQAMLNTFYESLAALAPHKNLPFIAILVSDEAATYRPEMDWIAECLQRQGKRVYTFHPRQVMPLGNTLCADMGGNPEQIDVIYRFWELFDLANVPFAEYVLDAWEDSELAISPPMRHFQEEKANLAIFHHHLLKGFWKENLSKKSFKLLNKVIPRSWIMDPAPLPPTAVLDAPSIQGMPISHWEDLANGSQKERNLIVKLSGFHESAWGARSVTLGNDTSREEFRQDIRDKLRIAHRNLSILQEYHKPVRLKHPVYADRQSSEGELFATYEMEGRLRLCPYYFASGDSAELTGVLATFCPADKKIIHGMSDAALLPCRYA